MIWAHSALQFLNPFRKSSTGVRVVPIIRTGFSSVITSKGFLTENSSFPQFNSAFSHTIPRMVRLAW